MSNEHKFDVQLTLDEALERIKRIEDLEEEVIRTVNRMDKRYYRSRDNYDEESDELVEKPPPEHPMLRGI